MIYYVNKSRVKTTAEFLLYATYGVECGVTNPPLFSFTLLFLTIETTDFSLIHNKYTIHSVDFFAYLLAVLLLAKISLAAFRFVIFFTELSKNSKFFYPTCKQQFIHDQYLILDISCVVYFSLQVHT